VRKTILAALAACVLGSAALASPAEARCWWNGYAWHCWHPHGWWGYGYRHHYWHRYAWGWHPYGWHHHPYAWR
jgi:hypothetical protein